MDSLPRFCCQNVDCSRDNQRDAGNLSVCDRYGNNQPIRLLYCKACKTRLSERKGMPLVYCCLAQETALSVLQYLVEGDGLRQAEQHAGVHRDTVIRLACRAGPQALNIHDELVAFSPRNP